MNILRFKRLINKHSKLYGVIRKGERVQVGPIFQDGVDLELNVFGAVFQLTTEDLRNYEAGAYTTQDIILYVVSPYSLTDNLGATSIEQLKINDIVKFQGNDYKIDKDGLFTEHSDFLEFVCKKVVQDEY